MRRGLDTAPDSLATEIRCYNEEIVPSTTGIGLRVVRIFEARRFRLLLCAVLQQSVG